MTKEQILNMSAGRELDNAVGKAIYDDELYRSCVCYDSMPNFSTDISDAWQVVEKLHEKGGCDIGCYGKDDGKWYIVNIHGVPEVTAHTAPEAICKAALLAVMEVEQ